MEVPDTLLGHRLPGLVPYCAHDSVEWRRMLRQAVTALETAYGGLEMSGGVTRC